MNTIIYALAIAIGNSGEYLSEQRAVSQYVSTPEIARSFVVEWVLGILASLIVALLVYLVTKRK